MPIRFSAAEEPPNHLRFDVPTFVPANSRAPGPLGQPFDCLLVEQYLPLRAIAHHEKIWTMINGVAMSAKTIEKAMGRMQWATVLPIDQIIAAALLGLEDGHPDHGTSSQGGPYVGMSFEGALHSPLRALVGMQRRVPRPRERPTYRGMVQ